MKITKVETFVAGNPWKSWLFVRVHTDEGIHGISEATSNGFARTVEAAIHELSHRYVGMDPFQVERITKRMYHDMYTDGGQLHKHAVAGIEVACWDIMGKALGVPVYKLLGGQMRARARAYANGWYRGERTPDNFHQRARLWAARQICDMADAHYGVVAPHNAQGPVCTAICMQLAACTPNFFVQEIFDEFNVEWESQLTRGQRFEVVDGYIDVPEAPGLGIDLNVDEIVKHPYDPSNFLPLFQDGWEKREGER